MLDLGLELLGYRIDAFVASGGMGAVYRATQLSLERVVALKLLSTHLSDDPAFRKRFHREAVLQATLEHPNILPVYEAGESSHGLFIAMRYVDGPSLKATLGQLDRRTSLALLAGVANALDASHRAGLIHRDIKPHNILLAAGGHAYLADFGLTTATGLSAVTQAGQFLGTLDYVSPEQIQEDGVDARSDVYSLGAVLYECMTGSVPFPRSSKVAVIYAHLEQHPRPPSEIAPELPAELDAVLARALAKRPEQRYETAGELIAAARQALERGREDAGRSPPVPVGGPGDPESITRTVSPAMPGARRRGRGSRRLAAALAVAVAALAAGGGYAAGHEGVAGGLGQTRTLDGDGVSVQVPASWGASPVSLPELFSGPTAAAGPGGAGSGGAGGAGPAIVVGRVRGFGPGMIPRTFSSVPNLAGVGQPVQLGDGAQGRLYQLTLQRRYRLVLVPTTTIDAGAACVAPRSGSDRGVLTSCGQVLASLRVAGAFRLDPRPEYAAFLNRALGALTRTVQREQRAFGAARDSRAQAVAAAGLGFALHAAEDQFQRLIGHGLSPAELGLQVGIRNKLGALSQAWLALSRAARARDPRAYQAARGVLGGAGQDLNARLDELSGAGYSLN